MQILIKVENDVSKIWRIRNYNKNFLGNDFGKSQMISRGKEINIKSCDETIGQSGPNEYKKTSEVTSEKELLKRDSVGLYESVDLSKLRKWMRRK